MRAGEVRRVDQSLAGASSRWVTHEPRIAVIGVSARRRFWRGLAVAAAVFVSSAWTPADPDPAARTSLADELTEVVASLRSDLEAIIRSASGSWRAARYSVLAISLDRGDTLF